MATTENKSGTTYRLSYFNGRGLGEVSRLLFAAAGVAFTDNRVEQKDWPTYKPQTPYGQMPVLEVNGKAYGQSGAIQRYLAREFGLFGSSELEGLQIDGIVEAINDARKVFGEARQEKDEEAKKAKFAAYFKDVWPAWGAKLTSILAANGEGKGYLVGSKLSLADIVIFNGLTFLQETDKDFLNSFPLLQGLLTRVAAIPKIATYLSARPVTW